jgi:site-specific recombinase XerD
VNEDPNQWPSDIPAELLVYMAAERGLSWNYLRLTQRSLMLFSNWLSKLHPGRAPDAVTIDHITEYLAMERRRGLAPASIKTLIAALKLFFSFLRERGITRRDPTATMRFPKVGLVLPEISNEQEAGQLLAVNFTCRAPRGRDRSLPRRDKAILELLYASGIRNSELVKSAIEGLDLDNRSLRVTGKGQKERLVVFGRPAAVALHDYLDNERPGLSAFAVRQALSLAITSTIGYPLTYGTSGYTQIRSIFRATTE